MKTFSELSELPRFDETKKHSILVWNVFLFFFYVSLFSSLKHDFIRFHIWVYW